jgi:hypothetical protein
MLAIYERDPPNHGLNVKLGDAIPTPSGGGGGYEEVPLPKRQAVTVWRGRSLMRMAITARFDDTDEEDAVESAYETLVKMYRPDKDTTPPPIVRVAASGDTIPLTAKAVHGWTIEDLEWGEAQGNAAGERVEQILIIKLMEFNPDERLRTAQKKKGKTIVHEVKNPKKETLGWIAKHYHVKGGVKALKAAQHPPIKDPRHTHKGQKITVPLP